MEDWKDELSPEDCAMITSAEEFVRLRCSQNPDEYRRAAHEPAPISVWVEVIENYPEMKQWVIHNKTVPIEILERLASDVSSEIRWWVAQKRKLSHELFAQLARDEDQSVRLRIACNKQTPLDVLQRLLHDEDDEVKNRAKERLAEL